MINLFRKIRRKLADENQFLKYFRYALGEIFLVVVGILIALQINNWNEERKSNKLQQYYLKSLKNSIRQDTASINFRLTHIDQTLDIIDSVTKITPDSTNQKFIAHLIPRIYMSTFNIKIETSTIDDLKSTGNLSLIKNKSLSELLLAYYKELESQEKGLNGAILTNSRETIGPYLMHNYSIIFDETTSIDEFEEQHSLTMRQLKKDLFLTNAIRYRKTLLIGLKIVYIDALSNANKILTLLESEQPNL